MNLRSLMTVRPIQLRGAMQQEEQTGPPSGVFVTKESLTFPGAATLVAFLLQLAERAFKGAKTSLWWSLGISLVIGLLIYWFSITEKMTRRENLQAFCIAIINILVLTGTGLGVGSVT